MSCRTNAGKVGAAAGAGGVPRMASQAGYEAGLAEDTAYYLPREGEERPLPPGLHGAGWPPPGKTPRHFWRDYAGPIKAALRAWRSQADDRALARLCAQLAAGLAGQAATTRRDGHPAGRAGELAEERARLLLAPPKSLSVGERVERVAVLDNALALMRLKRAIDEQEYRAALVDVLLSRRPGPPRSLAPVVWLPGRPVGTEEDSTSQVDPARKVRVRYRAVDLDEPTTSNTATGATNPDYDGRLQPRRRGRVASQAQIDAIARKLEAGALLKRGASWSDGPPLVGPDGMVESGNGRLLALRRAAEVNPDGYSIYRRGLIAEAVRFGLERAEVEKMKRPALVRERLTIMDDDARLRFIAEANASGAARMGGAEQARADAALIPPGFFAALELAESDDSLAGALTRKSNLPVVIRFFNLLPETERAALMDSRGELSADGVNRLERAMFAYTMPGPSGERLARLVFEEGEAIDRVGAGLKMALPRLGQAEDFIRAGRRARDLGLGDDLAVAVEKLRDLRRQGLSVNDYLRQYNLPLPRDLPLDRGLPLPRELSSPGGLPSPGGMYAGLTPFQEQLLAQLDGRRRSGRAVAGLINAYADQALLQPPPAQGTLFGAELAVTREGLLRSALKVVGGEWVDVSKWSAAQQVTSGLGVPACLVQGLTPAQQARGMRLANGAPADGVTI